MKSLVKNYAVDMIDFWLWALEVVVCFIGIMLLLVVASWFQLLDWVWGSYPYKQERSYWR